MMQLISRFGDRNAFLTKCSPSVQTAFARNPKVCYFGNYPTLADINMAYGNTMAAQWLIPQLYDLSQFSGANNITASQLEELARIIATEYPWLKVTELLLFFYKFKTGRYGKFYGAVDPLVITTAIREFVIDRRDAYTQHELEERQRKAEEDRRNTCSREEWLRMKEEKQKKNI